MWVDWVNNRVVVPKSLGANAEFGHFRSSEQHASGWVDLQFGKTCLPTGILDVELALKVMAEL